MGFIMDGLEAEAYDRTYSDRYLIARIIGYFRPKLRMMLSVAALIILSSLLDTAFPILISFGINAAVASVAARTIAILIGAILIAGI
ncbi:MAG: ABC transporter ATP-binding protein, partial [Ktedonobacteraceae bacterium]